MALDFETATSQRDSACALGVAVLERGTVTATRSWLIQPPGNRYEPWNTRIHGISAADTASAPTFADVYGEVLPFLGDRSVIAHSAPFDVSVLRALHATYGLALPRARYICSCAMSRRAFPGLADHRLPTVCDHCGIGLDHHDAASDALACGLVAVNCRDAVGADTITEAVSVLGMQLSVL